MPVTIVDRLPLPNLKVYSAGSVLLLSVAIYYAVNITSDPNWRANATLQRQDLPAEDMDDAGATKPLNATRNLTEQIAEVMTFMMQEPLCMWTVINMAYCALAAAGWAVQRAVFGRLRVAEAQRVKDKFWNYLFYKFIFVFGVLNVQYMDEVLLWCGWFTLVGALLLLTQLSKDRFEYLASSPRASRRAHGRLLALQLGVLAAGGALLAAAVRWGLPAGRDTFAFMAAEGALACVSCVHVLARFVLRARDADAAGPAAYYTHLVFDAAALLLETLHVGHMVVHSNAVVSMASMVLVMQLRHLLHALLARLRRHRLYTALADHMSRNYPMASPEEVDKNQDNCAICWEPMKEARKLPCAHLFHNSCLCRWVQQDASCPTCRRALVAQPARRAPRTPHAPHAPHSPRAPHAPHDPRADAANHFFHFDGSRYVSWLPSFSVEVTRVRADPLPVEPLAPATTAPAAAPAPDARAAPAAPRAETGPISSHLDAMLAQVAAVFPQYSAALVRADLLRTRSPHLTVENILEGRLPSPAPPDPPAAPSAPSSPSRRPASEPAVESASGSGSGSGRGRGSRAERAGAGPDGSESSDPIQMEFSKSASERESLLRRRKLQLVEAARRRYLERHALGAPGAPPPPPSPRG